MAKAGRMFLLLDVHYHEDARVTDVSPMAELLYIRCLCACKRLMNDGKLSNTQILRLGFDLCHPNTDVADLNVLTNELVNVGLLEGDPGSWMTVRSWAEWNKPSEEIEAISAARSAAGRAGGLKSGQVRSKTKQTASGNRTKLLNDAEANEAMLRTLEVEIEVETELEKRKSGCPSAFEISDHLIQWAATNSLTAVSLKAETDKFLDYHTAKGSKFVDWDRAWMTWIRKANEWAKDREPKRPYVARGADPLPPEDDYGEPIVLA